MLSERDGRYYVEIDRRVSDGNGGLRRVRKNKRLPAGTSRAQAEIIARTMEAEAFTQYRTIASVDQWDAHVDALLDDPRSWIYTTLNRCRHRSKRTGREFALTPSILGSMLRASRGRCAVTGLRFSGEPQESSRKRPYAYSLDRKDSAHGYTPDNCRIVCYAVNVAMLNWGRDVFAQLAVGYTLNEFGRYAVMQADGQNLPHCEGRLLRIK